VFKKILLDSTKDSYIKFVIYNPIVSYEVLTAVHLKIPFFWDVTICHTVRSTRHFKVSYWIHPSKQWAQITQRHIITSQKSRVFITPQLHTTTIFTTATNLKRILYTPDGRYIDDLTTCKLYVPSLTCSGIYNQQMHKISSYRSRHSTGASVGYVFQCMYSWFYTFIFTLRTARTILRYISLAAIFHQLSVTKSSTTNTGYYFNGMLSIVAVSCIT
jgi:hypothetical protein